MTEDDRETLISELVDEFRGSIGTAFDDAQKFTFIAGARSALVTMGERLAAQIAEETAKLAEVNQRPAGEVRDSYKILHAARVSALEDFQRLC